MASVNNRFLLRAWAGKSVYGDLNTRNERDITQVDSTELEIGMILWTQQYGDKNNVRLDADVITVDQK